MRTLKIGKRIWTVGVTARGIEKVSESIYGDIFNVCYFCKQNKIVLWPDRLNVKYLEAPKYLVKWLERLMVLD